MALIDALRGIELPEYLDSRWPSGFKSALLARMASERGSVFFSPRDEEGAEIIRGELSSLGITALLHLEDVASLAAPGKPTVFLGPPEGVGDVLSRLEGLRFLRITEGTSLSPGKLVKTLVDMGLERVGFVELPGEFARRGGIVDLFLEAWERPVRVEFAGDRVASLRSFSPGDQLSTGSVEEIWLPGAAGASGGLKNLIYITEEPSNPLGFDVQANPPFAGDVSLFYKHARSLAERGYRILFFTPEHWRYRRLNEVVACQWITGSLRRGFIIPYLRIAGLSSGELVDEAPARGQPAPGKRIESIEALETGDMVVHADYGIGRYGGLEVVRMADGEYECVVVEYEDGRLLVPSQDISRLSRYVGPEGYTPPLSRLSSPQNWAKKRGAAARDALRVARQLLTAAAIRKARRGHAFGPDTPAQKELEMAFPFPETPDQEKAIEEVKRDMESDRVTERLVAGEVGFGKTEVALRAAFKAVEDGKQVALLVPTTILALQHFKTFAKRLENFPVRVEVLSRLVPRKRARQILADLKEGKVDIIIGTHRLLAKDVRFRDLGLLIVDEEHRFGVKQKEHLRRLKLTVDTLLMTATPIPRTMSMALGEILDMSVIETPPLGRQEVETHVLEMNERVLRDAVNQELDRGGQVFYIYNRIETMGEVEARLRRLFPEARLRAVHGRCKPREIEQAFMDFYEARIDILLSTAIVESGVDFPNANTIIVERAELFGLSELHQLRGRVGRGTVKARAFFFTSKGIKGKAKRRLEALAAYHHLGSGMKIALADLAIRGGGDILGLRQHGRARGVGYSLYFSLLAEAVERLTGKVRAPATRLEFSVNALIPRGYVEDESIRMAYYKRLSEARLQSEIDDVENEIADRFGPLPPETLALIEGHRIRLWAQDRGYDRVRLSEERVILERHGREETWPKEEILKDIAI